MKFFKKKIYITTILLFLLLISTKAISTDNKIQYKQENISNYFSGIVFASKDYHNDAFEHFKETLGLKEKHSNFNIEYIRTLVFLDKFKEAFSFSESVWKENELFFEADLLLGLNFFIQKDYLNSEKHFKRLNQISEYNIFFHDFIGNILLSWNEASKNNKEKSFNFIDQIPKSYGHIVKIQKNFLNCYFDEIHTKSSFEKLTRDEDYNFSRYNFFLINYLLYKNNISEAKKVIKYSRKEDSANLLLKETEYFLSNNKTKRIKSFFNCNKPQDSIAEFFYILANLYSSEEEYQLSNFYLKISLFLNKKFTPNKALMAENFYFQKQNKLSKKTYSSIKSIGSAYSWFATKSISTIIENEKGGEPAIKNLKKEFDTISNPGIEHYYDLANYYKDYEYYEESIKYYSLILEKIGKDHFLVPKILYRRGTSFERIKEWESSEKDLKESLKIKPDQAHVLNYLAYSWIDKGINLDESLEMLIKAMKLSKNDGYITDSLGWAYYAKKNYVEAEFFLQKAVKLLPSDPIINDHYADVLWMLNKDIQARYFWKNILELKDTEQELREKVKKKLIFGINNKI